MTVFRSPRSAILAVLLGVLGAAASAAEAATEQAPTGLPGLLARVDLAAVVEVESASSFEGRYGRSDQAEALLTRYQLRVLQPVVGAERQEKVELVLPGGAIGERGFAISGVPLLPEGARLFLFLDLDQPGHALVGGDQGVLVIAAAGEGATAVRTLDGRPLIGLDVRGLILGRPARPSGGAPPSSVLTPVGAARVEPAPPAPRPLTEQELVAGLRRFAGERAP